MTQEREARFAPGGDLPDWQGIARDWITIWQSEINAAARDPEGPEAIMRLAALWAEFAQTMAASMPPAPFAAAPFAAYDAAAWSPQSARPAAAAAAPDARDLALARLADRVAQLERRLAAYERRDGAGSSDAA